MIKLTKPEILIFLCVLGFFFKLHVHVYIQGQTITL